MQETSKTILTFGEAIELCKNGTPVACTNMKSNEFIVLTPNQTITTDKFWNQHNKEAAERNNGWLEVKPYFLKTNVYSTVPYTFNNEDIFADWVVASTRRVCNNLTIDNENVMLEFKPFTAEEQKSFHPFWLVYSNLNMAKGVFIFISNDNASSKKLAVLTDALYSEYAERNNSLESISFDFTEDVDTSALNIRDYHMGATTANLTSALEDKLRDLYDAGLVDINIIIDVDSMAGIGFDEHVTLHDYVVISVMAVKSDFPSSWVNMSLDNPLG